MALIHHKQPTNLSTLFPPCRIAFVISNSNTPFRIIHKREEGSFVGCIELCKANCSCHRDWGRNLVSLITLNLPLRLNGTKLLIYGYIIFL